MSLLEASFDGADGTDLASYVPEVGPAFAVHSGVWQLAGNKLRLLSMTAGRSHATVNVGVADVTFVVQITYPASDDFRSGLIINRLNNGNYWMVWVNSESGGPGTFLYKVVTGPDVLAGSHPYVPALGSTVEWRVVTAGDNLKVYADDVLLIDHTETGRSFQTQPSFGVFDDAPSISPTLTQSLFNDAVISLASAETASSSTDMPGSSSSLVLVSSSSEIPTTSSSETAVDPCDDGLRRILLEPFFQRHFVANRTDGFRLRIVASQACRMPAAIFRYVRHPADPNTGEQLDEFTGVCSVADLAEFPVDDPDPTASPPVFRADTIDLVLESRQRAETIWQLVQDESLSLKHALDAADALVAAPPEWQAAAP